MKIKNSHNRQMGIKKNIGTIKTISLICLLQLFFSVNSFGQIDTKITKYSICKWNKFLDEEFDCTKKWGQYLYEKISVTPNKTIVTHLVLETDGTKMVTYNWDNANVRMNNDRDLYIYKLWDKDINFEGGYMLTIIFRLNYTVQLIKLSQNIKGEIINTTLFTD